MAVVGGKPKARKRLPWLFGPCCCSWEERSRLPSAPTTSGMGCKKELDATSSGQHALREQVLVEMPQLWLFVASGVLCSRERNGLSSM